VPYAELKPHIPQRALVFDDLRVLFVPVPKASCTAILWMLAELSGLDEDRFAQSLGREVTPELTIHDMSRWPDEHKLGVREPGDLEEPLTGEGWLRFTVVRNPFRRLWSAWQSKVLLAEPQFIDKFSDQPWYPHSVDSAEGVLDSFRAFLDALGSDPELGRADVHWAPQVGLIGHPEFALDHVGRVEQLDDTLDRLRRHVEASGRTMPQMRRANVTPLPYADELFTKADVEVLEETYADDLETFGYDLPPGAALDAPCSEAWLDAVRRALPVVGELRGRNTRIHDLERHQATTRAELRETIAQQRSRAERIQARLEARTAEFTLLRKDRNALRQLRREELRERQRLQRQLESARGQLESMRASLSWRVTGPLRWIRKLLPVRSRGR
jgi:hypothetical protein